EHQQAGVPPLSEIEGRVQEAITVQKMQPALRAYLQKLREDAYIKYADGYVDTGASPNQTAPIETTSKEAGAKELKKKKKKLGTIKPKREPTKANRARLRFSELFDKPPEAKRRP